MKIKDEKIFKIKIDVRFDRKTTEDVKDCVFSYEEIRCLIGALCYDIRQDYGSYVGYRIKYIIKLFILINEYKLLDGILNTLDDVFDDGRYLRDFDEYYGIERFNEIIKNDKNTDLNKIEFLFNNPLNIEED